VGDLMAAPDKPERVVVIDDDYAMRLSCRQILAKVGLDVETFEDGTKGLDAVIRQQPELVVVDLKMPGISGMDVISRLHDLAPNVVVTVITGYPTIASAVEAIKAGAYDFLPKPFTPDELRLVVRRGLERHRLQEAARIREMERELLKRRFVTFVSHQLKTPLVAIRQYLDLLHHPESAPPVAEQRQEWIARCLVRADEMLGLIDDWLTLSHVERGELSQRRDKVDLGDVLRHIIDSYELMAAERQVALFINCPADGYLLCGDHNCVAVLFDNLIVNAIKYNRQGGSVTVTAAPCDGTVTVEVRDTGVGIPTRYHRSLFDEFFRVRTEGTRRTGGSGLGLAICKQIVNEMHGSIDVASEEGVGTTFTVRLPLYRPTVQSDIARQLT